MRTKAWGGREGPRPVGSKTAAAFDTATALGGGACVAGMMAEASIGTVGSAGPVEPSAHAPAEAVKESRRPKMTLKTAGASAAGGGGGQSSTRAKPPSIKRGPPSHRKHSKGEGEGEGAPPSHRKQSATSSPATEPASPSRSGIAATPSASPTPHTSHSPLGSSSSPLRSKVPPGGLATLTEEEEDDDDDGWVDEPAPAAAPLGSRSTLPASPDGRTSGKLRLGESAAPNRTRRPYPVGLNLTVSPSHRRARE